MIGKFRIILMVAYLGYPPALSFIGGKWFDCDSWRIQNGVHGFLFVLLPCSLIGGMYWMIQNGAYND